MVGITAVPRMRHGRPKQVALLRLCAAFIVCDMAVAAVALVVFLSRSDDDSSPALPNRPASAPPPTAVTQAVAWVARELPHSATVLADAAVSRSLAAHGFTLVEPPDAAGRAIQFVVSTAPLRTAAKQYTAVSDVLTTSALVAVIGTGADAVSVRQVGAVSSADLVADARTRRNAENQLLTNLSVTASSAAKRLLRDGAVDLRAATFVALVAASNPVEVVRVNVDPAERAAGRPARSIEVRTSSAAHLRRVVSDASPEYRVARYRTLADGTVRLVWPVDAQPLSRP